MNIAEEILKTTAALIVIFSLYQKVKGKKAIAGVLFTIAILLWLTLHITHFTSWSSFILETIMLVSFILVATWLIDDKFFIKNN